VPSPAGRALNDLLRLRSLFELFEGTLRTGESSHETARLSDDAVWEVLVFPLPPGSRAAAVGVLRDITRLERTEAMRRTFVADVSHELRTPISSIAAAAETLADGNAEDADARELVGVIRRQAGRMRELIDDLTDLAQIEGGGIALEKEMLALASLLREVAQDLDASAREKRVEVVVSGDESAVAPADRRRLAQVARNLLDNAIKFSPVGSSVELHAFAEPGRAGFSVSDRGPGIPKGERDRFFQRFYQIDRSRSKARPGSGLGLSIVKHLVQLHGGSVEVEGNVGEGSRFVVRLPA
jgi:two-component system phosphate regulon sensor histidine kinase PhoR